MTDRTLPSSRALPSIPSYAEIAEATFGTLWKEAQPADWALIVHRLMEAQRSENAPAWISVKDRMPPHPKRRTHYWVVSDEQGFPPEYVVLARWTGECFKSADCDARMNKVSHWMPIPTLPSERDGA